MRGFFKYINGTLHPYQDDKPATDRPMTAYGIMSDAHDGPSLYKITGPGFANALPFFSETTQICAFNASGAFPCFDLAFGTQESVEQFRTGARAGAFLFAHLCPLSPEQTRIGHCLLATWLTFLNSNDPRESLCTPFFEYLESHPGASETELAAISRPIFDAASSCCAKSMFDIDFNDPLDRHLASLAAMGQTDSSPAKAARASAEAELAKLENILIRIGDEAGAGSTAHIVAALDCARNTHDALLRLRRPLASVWGSRRILNIDRELADQLADNELPRSEDGASMAGALLKTSAFKGLVLSYAVENPLSTQLSIDFTMTWAASIEADGHGNPLLHMACAIDPATNSRYVFKVALSPDFDEDKLREAVTQGLQETTWLDTGPTLISDLAFLHDSVLEKNTLIARDGFTLSPKAVDHAARQAKIALNALFYTCCSDPQIRREAKSSTPGKKHSAFSDMVQTKAAQLSPPTDPSLGGDALWLGCEFDDFVRRERAASASDDTADSPF